MSFPILRAGAALTALLVLRLLLVPAPARAQAPTPAVDPQFFAYDSAAPFAVAEEPMPPEDGVRVSRLTFPSLVQTPFAVNNTVTTYLFLPPGPGPHPAMLVLHEWNASTTKGAARLCRAITQAGVAALLMVEPYSLNRRPQNPHPKDAEILTGNVPQMQSALRQAVLDARRGLDILQRRPDIDPNRLGVGGISLGGVLSGLIAKVDRRVNVVLTLVGGADFARGLWNGLLTRRFRPEIRRRGYSFATFQEAMAPFEAENWQRAFDPKNALVIAGRYDLVVLPEQAKALARTLGGADVTWVNTGHYGAALSAGSAIPVAARFLRARFFGENTAYQPPGTLPSRTIKVGLLLGGREGLSPAAAVQLLNFDTAGRFSLDGQLTLHGLSAALSARLGPTSSIGLELPLGHGTPKMRPFLLLHITL